MIETPTKLRTQKRSVVLMPRDLLVLGQLNVHRAITSSQLAKLCFEDITYETSRKRLRKLQQAGFIGFVGSDRLEGRGRPEMLYFLTAAGAKSLERYRGISYESIPIGPPHSYHKEHYLRLVDIRLALMKAQKSKVISDLEWNVSHELGPELANNQRKIVEQADATISFCYSTKEPRKVLLVLDRENFRQIQHWEPKIKAFLKLDYPVWIIADNQARIVTLGKWTLPLLEQTGVDAGKCIFAVYDELINKGITSTHWLQADGKHTDIKHKA